MTTTRRRTTRKKITKIKKDGEEESAESSPKVVKTRRVKRKGKLRDDDAMEDAEMRDAEDTGAELARDPESGNALVQNSTRGEKSAISTPHAPASCVVTPKTLYEHLYTLMIQQSCAIVVEKEIVSPESYQHSSILCASPPQHPPLPPLIIHWHDFTEAQVRKALFQHFLQIGYGNQFREIMLICILHEKLNGLLLIHDIVEYMTERCPPEQQNDTSINHHFLFHHLSKLLNECYMRFLVKIQYTPDEALVGYASNYSAAVASTSTTRKRPRTNSTSTPPPELRKTAPHVLYSNFFYTVSWFGNLMLLLLKYAYSFITTETKKNQLEKENSHFIGAFFCQLVENVRGKMLWICFRRQHPDIFFKQVAPLLIQLSSHESSPSYIRDLKETITVIKNAEPTWISPLEYGYISFNAHLPQKAVLLVYSLILDQLTTDDIMVTSMSNTLAQLLCIRSIHSVTPSHFLFDVIHAAIICSLRVVNKQHHETMREKLIVYSFLYVKLVLLIKEYKKEYTTIQKRLPSMPAEDPLTHALLTCDKRIADSDEMRLLRPLIQRCAQMQLMEESTRTRYGFPAEAPPLAPLEQASKSIFQSFEHHMAFIHHVSEFCKAEVGQSTTMETAHFLFSFICDEPLTLDLLQLHGIIPDLLMQLLKVIKVVYQGMGQESHQAFSLYISALYFLMERFRFRDTPHHKAYLEQLLTDLNMDVSLRTSLLTYLHPQFIHTTTEAQQVGDELLSVLESQQARLYLSRVSPLQILGAIPYVTQQWFLALRTQILTPDLLRALLVEAIQVCGVHVEVMFYFTFYHIHRFDTSPHIATLLQIIHEVGSCTRRTAAVIWLRKLHSTFQWFAGDTNATLHAKLEEMSLVLDQSESSVLSYAKFTQEKGSIEYYNLDKLTEDNMDMKKAVELLKMPKLSQFVFLKQLRHSFSLSAFVRLIFDSFANTLHAEVDQAQRGGYEFGNIVGYNGLKYFLQHMLPCIYQRGDMSTQSETYAKKLAIFSSYACIRVFSRGNFPCIEGLAHFLRQCLQSDNDVSVGFAMEYLSVLMRLSAMLSAILFSPDTRTREGNALALVWKDASNRLRTRNAALGAVAAVFREVDVLQFFDFKMIVDTKDEDQISLIMSLFTE